MCYTDIFDEYRIVSYKNTDVEIDDLEQGEDEKQIYGMSKITKYDLSFGIGHFLVDKKFTVYKRHKIDGGNFTGTTNHISMTNANAPNIISLIVVPKRTVFISLFLYLISVIWMLILQWKLIDDQSFSATRVMFILSLSLNLGIFAAVLEVEEPYGKVWRDPRSNKNVCPRFIYVSKDSCCWIVAQKSFRRFNNYILIFLKKIIVYVCILSIIAFTFLVIVTL